MKLPPYLHVSLTTIHIGNGLSVSVPDSTKDVLLERYLFGKWMDKGPL
jgi:hypothetical protein